MKNNQGIQKDFKDTELGAVPNHWDISRLNKYCDVKTGPFGAQLHQKDYVSKGTPIITVEHLGETGLIHEDIPRVSDEDKERLSQYILKSGDIVFSRVGWVDRNSLITNKEDGWLFSGRLLRVRSKSEAIFSPYLSYYFHSTDFKTRVKRVAVGGTMPCLNTSLLSNMLVLIPPFSEQKRIAEILSTWDRAIEGVQRLIEARHRLKKGLTQRLLTGQLRFPGFGKPISLEDELPEGWQEVELKQVSQVLVSNVDKLTGDNEDSVLLCNYMDVYSNEYITNGISFMRASASKAEIERFRLYRGDILLTKDSETSQDIAYTAVVTDEIMNLVCGYHLAIIRPDIHKINPVFLSKILIFGRFHNHFVTHANGVTRYGLTISAIENAPVWVPSLDEQTKIANQLSDCDKEIILLQKQAEKLRIQKQGLMQKLLTGEIRVVKE